MKKEYYKRSTCRLCDSTRVYSGVKFEATPPGDTFVTQAEINRAQKRYPIDVCLCEDCGSIQLLDVVNPEILYGPYLYQTSISLGLPEHFRRYADEVLAAVAIKPGSLVIDIGSNDGTLLRCFQERGMKVLGIDPASAAVKTALARGVDTIQAFFDRNLARKIRSERGDVGIVAANNVIANVDALGDFVDGIRELIEPNGYFVMETGCGASLLEKRLIDVVYHEHLSYFTVKPLEGFFRRHGMKIIDAYWIPSKGGSIRCFVQADKSSAIPKPSVREMIYMEEDKGIGTMDSLRKMGVFITERKKGLTSLLDGLRAQGKTIVGYGASVGVTTLLYLFGLDKYLDYLVDDDATRFERFSPGQHIPVYSSVVLNEKNPDYVLILAWRYTDPIMKRHEKYIQQGGRFISLLPELKIFGVS
ncbi:MAG: class I SAM-dependent methyltransferase [Candidatus Omnitrophota bacterium]|nr:class I SAM-dependent methyltransferase [Candidatus Omnitrophota bacterium]